ncbi:MAG: 2-isopropylmalate synthase [Verrucomicrobia bacterium ADurb.Bin474]|nr:MAG: 2-isopropylmalate synthase [Verrucomicrobia bacterium ADurb.Bin474]
MVGKRVFSHESGIHCAGLVKDRRTYEPFDPGLVGHTCSEIVLGYGSGKASLKAALRLEGVLIDEDQLAPLLASIRNESLRLKRALTRDEWLVLHKQSILGPS